MSCFIVCPIHDVCLFNVVCCPRFAACHLVSPTVAPGFGFFICLFCRPKAGCVRRAAFKPPVPLGDYHRLSNVAIGKTLVFGLEITEKKKPGTSSGRLFFTLNACACGLTMEAPTHPPVSCVRHGGLLLSGQDSLFPMEARRRQCVLGSLECFRFQSPPVRNPTLAATSPSGLVSAHAAPSIVRLLNPNRRHEFNRVVHCCWGNGRNRTVRRNSAETSPDARRECGRIPTQYVRHPVKNFTRLAVVGRGSVKKDAVCQDQVIRIQRYCAPLPPYVYGG